MTAKQYLKQIEKLNTNIEQKLQELSALKSKAINISPCAGGTPVQHSSNDKICSIVARYTDLADDINKEVDFFFETKHFIINQIQGLHNVNYQRVLYKRYVELKSFEKIAVEVNYTYAYVIELHGHALQDFERTYKNLHLPVL